MHPCMCSGRAGALTGVMWVWRCHVEARTVAAVAARAAEHTACGVQVVMGFAERQHQVGLRGWWASPFEAGRLLLAPVCTALFLVAPLCPTSVLLAKRGSSLQVACGLAIGGLSCGAASQFERGRGLPGLGSSMVSGSCSPPLAVP